MTTLLAPVASTALRPGAVPTFAVVIAAYQAAATIAEAIESALDQTVPPLEVVVCDDGSTDDLDRAVEPYRGRITFVRRPHLGVAAAKNAAVAAASADYVCILDADDVYLPTRLEVLGRVAAERPDLAILTTDADLEAGRHLLRRYYDGTAFPVDDQRTAILEGNFILGLAAVSRDALVDCGGFDEGMESAVDWDCWIRLILGGARAGLVEESLARYRLRPTGISSDRVRRRRGGIRALEKALEEHTLTAEERAAAERSLARQRREAALAEAHRALLEGRPDARSRLVGLARDAGQPVDARLRAAAAAALPGVARRRLVAQDRRTWVTAGGIRVPW